MESVWIMWSSAHVTARLEIAQSIRVKGQEKERAFQK